VHGLTTAAAIWEYAAIGMAAAAGLLMLAVAVTALHLVIIFGFGPLTRRLTRRPRGTIHLHVRYQDERGVLRQLLSACERRGWQVTSVVTERASGGLLEAPPESGDVAVAMTISGTGVLRATRVLATVDGVSSVRQLEDEAE
jgi:putative Mg2+ transporter-C (MgtC) family protein